MRRRRQSTKASRQAGYLRALRLLVDGGMEDGSEVRFDADETAFVTRDLEYIRAQALEVQFPEIMFRQMVPISNEAPAGAKSTIHRVYEYTGESEFISDYADDPPAVGTLKSEKSVQFK
jgi:hypothetical protein